MDGICNCHMHTFTNRAVPNGFLPLRLMQILRWRPFSVVARWVLPRLWFTDNDLFDRLAAFLETGGEDRQEDIFLKARSAYPHDTRFVALSMDMDRMGAGDTPQPFLAQLKELAELKVDHGDQIIPFVAADARRPNVSDLVRTQIEDNGFRGIKLYPPLGFAPFGERLQGVYTYAEQNEIPIITHCSRGGIYFKGEITEEMRLHPRTGEMSTSEDRREIFAQYSEPQNYRQVLEEFPKLKLCLAHYGGDKEWRRHLSDPENPESWLNVISDLIAGHENVYADISFTAHEPDFFSLIGEIMETEKLREKILYGSDFYMVRLEASDNEFMMNLREAIGDDAFRQMAVINPVKFLSTKLPEV